MIDLEQIIRSIELPYGYNRLFQLRYERYNDLIEQKKVLTNIHPSLDEEIEELRKELETIINKLAVLIGKKLPIILSQEYLLKNAESKEAVK